MTQNVFQISLVHYVLLFILCCLLEQDILEQAQRLSPKALVIDSIQTVYLTGVTGSSGGDMQVLIFLFSLSSKKLYDN